MTTPHNNTHRLPQNPGAHGIVGDMTSPSRSGTRVRGLSNIPATGIGSGIEERVSGSGLSTAPRRSRVVLEGGILCRVVFIPMRRRRARFEVHTLDGEVLGKYSYVTDALDEARAYDIEHQEHQ